MCLHAEVKIGLWFLDISVEYLETWSSFINSIFVVVILVVILLWIPEAYSENLFFLVYLVSQRASSCHSVSPIAGRWMTTPP